MMSPEGRLLELCSRTGKSPCLDSLEWVRTLPRGTTAQQAWDACPRGVWLRWLLLLCGRGYSDPRYTRMWEVTYQYRFNTNLTDEAKKQLYEAKIVRRFYPKPPRMPRKPR